MSWTQPMTSEDKRYFKKYLKQKKKEKRCNLLFKGKVVLKDKPERFCFATMNKLRKQREYAGFSNYFEIVYL